MSNDLISRSAFIKEINEYMRNVYGCEIESVYDYQTGNESKASYIVQGLLEAFGLIKNMPIAYDVDKVVERLMCESINCHIMTDRAVEIVKSGGIIVIQDETVLKAMDTIRQYCAENKCKDCVILDGCGYCMFRDGCQIPRLWQIRL